MIDSLTLSSCLILSFQFYMHHCRTPMINDYPLGYGNLGYGIGLEYPV